MEAGSALLAGVVGGVAVLALEMLSW